MTRNEITTLYAKAETLHPDFPLGSRFGFAAAVMKLAKFRQLHNPLVEDADEMDKDDWEFKHP